MVSLKKHLIKKTLFLFLLSWLFGILFIPSPKISQAINADKVILLVWDGTQRNHLNELLSAGKLPNLQKLINEGRFREMRIFTQNCRCANDGDNYHTETGPGHAAMLTGYGFPETNNHANRVKGYPGMGSPGEYDSKDCPEYCPAGSNEECYYQLGPNPIPEGYTVFERLKAFNPNIKTGMITGKDHNFFPLPAFKHAAPSSCCSSRYRLCGDGNAIDTCNISEDNASTVTPRFLQFLEENKESSFFLFAHYGSPDSEGHAQGENSQLYSNAIITDDRETGKVIEKLKNLGIYEETIILVTTDHGFVEGGTQHHSCVAGTKNIWIVSNHKNIIDRQGVTVKQTSIVPTLFDIFGISKNVSPSFAGESLFTPKTTATPTPKPSFNLIFDWNRIVWPTISGYNAKSSLEDIDSNCGVRTGLTIAEKRKDWWLEYVAGFGGNDFELQSNQDYFINITKDCYWEP